MSRSTSLLILLIEADSQGVLCSQIFSGLDLHVEAFWSDKLPTLLATLQASLARAEHQQFVQALQAREVE